MKRLQQKAKPVNTKKNMSESSSEDEKATKAKSRAKKADDGKASKPGGSFLSLEQSIKDETCRVFKNDRFVCIRDKYPKSRCHLLLIPVIEGLKLLRVEEVIRLPNAIDFLKEMQKLSSEIISNLSDSLKKLDFKCGFHAVQSMQPLHMHIISNDHISDSLKNKKHYNSFTSPYFVKLNDLINHLENDLDNLNKDYFAKDKFNLKNRSALDEYLKMDLKCHHCQAGQSNIPNLKKHLLTHVADKN